MTGPKGTTNDAGATVVTAAGDLSRRVAAHVAT